MLPGVLKMEYLSIREQGKSWITDLIVYTEKFVIHQQIECRGNLKFCRIKKRQLTQEPL